MYCVVLCSGFVVLLRSCLCLPVRGQERQINCQLTLKLLLTVHSTNTYTFFNNIQLILTTKLFVINFQLHFAVLCKTVTAQLD